MASRTPGLRPFPAAAFLAIVILVCAGLAGSAIYTFRMLSTMREDYLLNRARLITSLVDAQARGPGVRRVPGEWQKILNGFQGLEDLEFIVLVDQSGTQLAGRSLSSDISVRRAPPGFSDIGHTQLFVAEIPVTSPRGHFGPMAEIAGWRLRVGLETSTADFIRRAAQIQAIMSGAAIALLLLLAVYLRGTVRRFVELKDREQAERRLKALGTMSASLAHEIRNPLGAIKGLTQLVQEELPKDHSGQSMMTTVVAETERLERLVTELLDFARPRSPELTDLDYTAILGEVKMMLEPRLSGTGKSVEISAGTDPIRFRSDTNGLRQVLLNVVLNALEATPEGKAVAVRARLEDSSQTLVTEVDDAGPGIGTKDPEELFEPFFTTRTKGTGLGLSISRQIVESLGGTIRLSNAPSGGARCTMRIPRATSR